MEKHIEREESNFPLDNVDSPLQLHKCHLLITNMTASNLHPIVTGHYLTKEAEKGLKYSANQYKFSKREISYCGPYHVLKVPPK